MVASLLALATQAGELFDMAAIRDATTLDVKVLKDWHSVRGEVMTRQKLITIRVGELVPGGEYRLPVRLIAPHDRKAKGFHLTGGHQLGNMQNDFPPRGVDAELLRGGVGLVFTVVQVLPASGLPELGRMAERQFIKTLNPKHSIQYWGWPAALMRATTAAYAEKDHFERGKVAMSGGSKNGASPSVALLQDDRLTALHASVSPIWPSPLRLCDEKTWTDLGETNKQYAARLRSQSKRINERQIFNHSFLGGTFGPVYNRDAIEAGHKWSDLQRLAKSMSPQVFIAPKLTELKKRGVEVLFHPGTHDFVAFDLAWGGKHYPNVPVYLRANSGHGIREPHPAAERSEQNKAAFLLHHFFGGERLLPSPRVKSWVNEKKIEIKVSFPAGAQAQSGQIWWIYDRGPDGSAAYLGDLFPKNQSAPMKYQKEDNSWNFTLPTAAGKKHIDFFSNHLKIIRRGDKTYKTYISSPYTRVLLN